MKCLIFFGGLRAIHLNFNSKSENRIGYFKIEIEKAITPFYFDNHKKLTCISSAINLVKVLTPEQQKNELIFNLIEKFYILLDNKEWIKDYIFWELELFRILGYDLEFNNLVEKKITGDQIQYISKSSTDKKVIPNFLIDKDLNSIDDKTLLSGLKLVGDYLEKTILKPNNMSQPISRLQFINTLR